MIANPNGLNGPMPAPQFRFDAPIQPVPEYLKFGSIGQMIQQPQAQPQTNMPTEQIPLGQPAGTGYNNAALQAPRMRLADLMGMYRNAGL